ncbi:unnamed protein product [Closterium sp. Yama58-4]|nr:unnamed protein product [Closterium sp. Yama58-4]
MAASGVPRDKIVVATKALCPPCMADGGLTLSPSPLPLFPSSFFIIPPPSPFVFLPSPSPSSSPPPLLPPSSPPPLLPPPLPLSFLPPPLPLSFLPPPLPLSFLPPPLPLSFLPPPLPLSFLPPPLPLSFLPPPLPLSFLPPPLPLSFLPPPLPLSFLPPPLPLSFLPPPLPLSFLPPPLPLSFLPPPLPLSVLLPSPSPSSSSPPLLPPSSPPSFLSPLSLPLPPLPPLSGLSQVTGPSAQMTWIRGGPASLDPVNITSAIDTSLQRLQCDYIDLLQLHWPDRYVPMFGDWEFDPRCDYSEYSPFEAQLEALGRAVEAGGSECLGNEAGIPVLFCSGNLSALCDLPSADAAASADAATSPDAATSANASTSADAATSASIDTARLLAQSLDLHQGTDSTTSSNGIFQDPSWRLVKYRNRYAEAEGRYPIGTPRVATAVRAYADVARRFHVSPVQLALAFVLAHPFVGAAVVGASSLEQLEEILSVVGEGGGRGGMKGNGRGEGIEFTEEMRAAIDAVHGVLPNPTP